MQLELTALLNVPSLQISHAIEPDREYLPAEQLRQSEIDDALIMLEYVPA